MTRFLVSPYNKVHGGGRLFKAGHLITFSAFRMDAYSKWALIRGWALIQINMVLDDKTQFCVSLP